MLFFFPISTDAPVYYWPYATVGLIVANVLVFFGLDTNDPSTGWLLVHGAGLHPQQWLLSMFAHLGIGHLISNMIFLWVFGLVAEGKLGWLRFLLCYLGIGVGQSAFEQAVMLTTGEASYSLGASSAIYGVMAMAAVWAPKNEISFFYFFWLLRVFTGTFEAAIGWVAAFYVGIDLLVVTVTGGQMSSSWLHVTGALAGLPLGIALLKLGVVDCEGWDMFHVWKGDLGAKKELEEKRSKAAEERSRQRLESDATILAGAQHQFHKFLTEGNAVAAMTLYNKLRHTGGGLDASVDELKALVGGLHKAGRFRESAPFMADLIRRAPDIADPVRLKLAQVCVAELDRPGRAIDLLAEVEQEGLNDKHLALADKIRRRAEQMQSEGLVEMDDDAW